MGRLFSNVEAFDVQAVRKESFAEGKTAGADGMATLTKYLLEENQMDDPLFTFLHRIKPLFATIG